MMRGKSSRESGGGFAARAGLALLAAALAAALLAPAAIPPALAAAGWSDPDHISTGLERNESARIAVDSRGVAHVVWHTWATYQVWYARGTPGDWSEPMLISTHSEHGQWNPQIALGPGGSAHAVWMGYGEDEDYSRIWYSTGSGDNWSDPALLSTQSGYWQWEPQIALGPDGSAHAVWMGYGEDEDYSRIWYSANAEGGWPAPALLSTQSFTISLNPR